MPDLRDRADKQAFTGDFESAVSLSPELIAATLDVGAPAEAWWPFNATGGRWQLQSSARSSRTHGSSSITKDAFDLD